MYQQLSGAVTGMIYGSPAYYNGVLYYAADGDSLKAFPVTNARVGYLRHHATAVKFQHPSATPPVHDGTQNGIVWALEANAQCCWRASRLRPDQPHPRVLQRRSGFVGPRQLRQWQQFIAPLIVKRKVYVGTAAEQHGAVFGLLPH